MIRDRLPAPPVRDLEELIRILARRAIRKPRKLQPPAPAR
jgi:hypothetical protein